MSHQSLKEALAKIRQELPEHIEMIILKAELCREYYIELLNQGFKEAEALELCKYFQL